MALQCFHVNIYVLQIFFVISTYDVQLENLADFRVGRDLAVEVSCVRRVCEFQLQSVLTASAEENVNLSNSSID